MAQLERYAVSDLPRLGRMVRSAIRRQGIVALPTETFYGFSVDPFSEEAVGRLLRVKGREDGKPVLILLAEPAQLSSVASTISPGARLLMERFWPGALTILLPAHPALSRNLTGNTGRVGVRLSSCAPLIELLRIVGPVTGTSANRAGCPPLTTAEDVLREFDDQIELVVDAGPTPGGLPSTVIDPGEPMTILREGAVSRQMIQNVLETHGMTVA
ncbi:MAG TPA: L-threonylcarbamoyladenylate synthase [Nitrospira sp.]|nr:L-threonylcarbamoyladenylate synthase [Nitrospira sp.]